MKYLYNGVEHPALPSEISEYRNAFIYELAGNYNLALSKAYDFGTDESSWEWKVKIPDGSLAYLETAEQGWKQYSSTSARNIEVSSIKWANFDVLNYDGSVFLKASEPVPVSAYTPNPAAMVNGWLMGQAVRRMRGS